MSKQIRIQVNLISRIAYGTTEWNFMIMKTQKVIGIYFQMLFLQYNSNGSIPDDYIISIITDNVNVEYFESTIVAVEQEFEHKCW